MNEYGSELLHERRDAVRRFGLGLALSLLVHLLIALLVSLWIVEPTQSEESIEVPLSFEAPPEPMAALQPAPAEEPAQPAPEETQPEPPPRAPDDSLLGFASEGEIEGRPDRPVGPAGEIHGVPLPGGAREEMAEDGEATDEPLDATAPAPEPEIEPAPDTSEPAPAAAKASEPERGVSRPESPPDETTFTPEEDSMDPVLPEAVEAEPATSAPPADERPEPGSPRDLQIERTPRPVPPKLPEGPGRSIDYDVDLRGAMFGDVRFDSRDYQWSEYSTKVYFAVWHAWLRELYSRVRRFEREQKLDNHRRLDSSVDIHFVINRDGSVSDLEVVDPSVLGTLDDASRAALLRAVLPPLPEDFPRDSEGVTFRFILSVDNALLMERGLRRQLGR